MSALVTIIALLSVAGVAIGKGPTPAPGQAPAPGPAPVYPTAGYNYYLFQPIIEADLFDPEPKIFSAVFAFEGIQGIPDGDTEQGVVDNGGTWESLPQECINSTNGQLFTTANTPQDIANVWGWPCYYCDAMPVVFSWPVSPYGLNNTDFELTLNTGEKVNPDVAAYSPNWEWNERQVVVVFGEFGNRLDPETNPDAVWVTQVEIVDDGSPLMLVGPNGKLVSGVGLTFTPTGTSYGKNRVGPKLAAAKLNYMKDTLAGEGTSTFPSNLQYPNHCNALYDNVEYRLRMYTTGGMTPDGIRGLWPTDYAKYFRVQLTLPDGKTMMLNETNVPYKIPGEDGAIEIFGLADLGLKEDNYTLCYASDNDNYIDICFNATENIARMISFVEMPHGNSTADPEGKYEGLYNPGGPGNNPPEGTEFTTTSGYQLMSVLHALDDPMMTSYPPSNAPGPAPSSKGPSPSGGGGKAPGQAPGQAPGPASAAVGGKNFMSFFSSGVVSAVVGYLVV